LVSNDLEQLEAAAQLRCRLRSGEEDMVPHGKGPRGHFLIGALLEYEEDRLGFLMNCAREYGGVVPLARDLYFLADAELMRQALVRTNDEFIKSTNFLRDKVDGRKDATSTQRWMHARGAALRGLNKHVVEAHVERIGACVEARLGEWDPGLRIDVVHELELVTSDLVADYCFGSRSRGVPERSGAMLDALFPIVSSPFRYPRWLPIPRNRQVARELARLEATVAERLVTIRADGGAEWSLARELLERGLDDHAAGQTLIATLLAAHGVPAAALAWTWYLLGTHDAERRRVQDEVVAALGRGPVSARVMGDLPYLVAVVRESLRLYPPTWLNAREVHREITLGDVRLRPGQRIMFSPYVVQRDPRYFDEPDAFLPGRWLGQESRVSRAAYVPFGGGPRACLGYGLAMTELVVVMALIARRFELRLDAPERVTPDARRTLTPASLYAVPQSRTAQRAGSRAGSALVS
jgi:unspecific monooxygenase